MQKKTSMGVVGALVVAAAGFVVQPDAFAQQTSARVATANEARQKDEFTRLLESTKVLNQALKRVSEQKKADNASLVQANEQKIREAESAAADGRIAAARILIDDAYLSCKLALADLAPKSSAAAQPAAADTATPKMQKDYAARMDSTRALRDALARIAQEKNDDAAKAELGVIDKLIRDADAQVAQNNVKRGRAILDHGYLRAKVQIERLRGGETLVRELKFDTREDEYRYELDRNDTYAMLLKLLAQPGQADEAKLKAHLERAARLRKEAEGQAAKKGFDDAVKTMEESSGEYQRALRTAGVMIPG